MNKLTNLKDIEVRIEEHMTGATEELIKVGALLTEAKDRKLVPHGQWGAWVKTHTGFSERQAQRLMQAAREIPEGSALMRLGFSQIQVILALPEAERESVAEKAVEEDMTVRKLREMLAKQKEITAQARALADEINEDRRRVMEHNERMRAEIDARLEREPEVRYERTPEDAQRIRELELELKEVEAYAEAQNDLVKELRKKSVNETASANVVEDVPIVTTVNDCVRSMRTMVTECGVLAYMGVKLAGIGSEQRNELEGTLRMIEDLARNVRAAMDTVLVEVV